MTLKNYRAPLLSNIKLYASFHYRMWIQTGVTVRKRMNRVMTSVTLTFDFWSSPFAWTSLLSLVITPENFVMIRWWEHSRKGVTDRQTKRTDWTVHKAAWSQLKTVKQKVVLQAESTSYRSAKPATKSHHKHSRIDQVCVCVCVFADSHKEAWKLIETGSSWTKSLSTHHCLVPPNLLCIRSLDSSHRTKYGQRNRK